MATLSALYTSAEKDFAWIDDDTKHPTSTLRTLPEGPGRERDPLTKNEDLPIIRGRSNIRN